MTIPLFESRAGEVVKQSVRGILTGDEVRFAEQCQRNWDFYRGETDLYFQRNERETKTEFDTKHKHTLNVTAPIVDAYVDNIYGLGVDRKFSGAGFEAQQKLLESLVKWAGGKLFWTEKVQLITEVSGTCAVVPRFNPKTRRLRFQPYSAEYVTPWPAEGDHETLIGFDVAFPQARMVDGRLQERVYLERWTDKGTYEVFWGRDRIDAGLNPYWPTLPIVPFRARFDPASWYGMTPISDVSKGNRTLNEYLTKFAQLVNKQGFAQLVITGGVAGELEVGPGRALQIPGEGVDAKYLRPGAPLGELLQFFDWWLTWVSNQARVPVKLVNVSAGETESGYALSLRWRPFLTALTRKRELYRQSELDLWRLAFEMLTVHNNAKGGIDHTTVPDVNAIDELVVDFDTQVIPTDPREKRSEQEWLLAQGAISQIDIYLEYNPDVPRDKARANLEDNLKVRDELSAMGAKAQADVLNRPTGGPLPSDEAE